MVDRPERPKSDELEFMSPRLSALLAGGSRKAHWLGRSVALFCVCFVIWAYFAPLNEQTRGQGKVVTSTRLQTISNLEGGIVKEILVQEGQPVSKGQILVRLDTTASEAKYRQDAENYYRQLASQERLVAQIQNQPFLPSRELQTMAPQIAQEEIARYQARVQKFQNDVQILQQEIAIKREEMAETQARYKNFIDQMKIAQQQKAMIAPLAERGLSPKVETFRLERDIIDLQNQAALTLATLKRHDATLRQTEDKIQQVILTYQQENTQELKDIELRLTELSGSRTAIEDRVRRAEIVSPVDGVIREMKIRTVGGVIQPGEAILDIAPNDENLLIEIQIAPENMAYIHSGMPALIKFTSYDFSIYGGLDAVVENISSDVILDKREIPSFRVILRTKRNYLIKEGRSYPIKPGMQVEADIRTGKKTVLTYLLKPFLRGIQSSLSER